MSNEADLLSANEAFYRAFHGRDMMAMEQVWARHAAVTCVHPGWGPLFGRESVMQSWAGILNNPAAPEITCVRPQAVVLGDVGYVLCFEALADSFLVATNIFARDGDAWRMVHHQAGGVPSPIASTAQGVPPTMQ